MSEYASPWTKATTSTTVGVVAIEAPAAAQRRFELRTIRIGCSTASGDVGIQVALMRTTAVNTGTAVVPSPLDVADAAAIELVKSNVTVEGATTATAVFQQAFNLRGGLVFDAAPSRGIIVAATASAGLLLQTPTLSGGTPTVFGEFRHSPW